MKVKEIWFDMDGTIADLYGVNGWLKCLDNEQTTPYENAKPMINMSQLARILNKLHNNGYSINIVSWGSKCASPDYLERIKKVKIEWLKKHLKSVKFDRIDIIEYGTPKQINRKGLLFDDELRNRQDWQGIAFDETNIIEVLKRI